MKRKHKSYIGSPTRHVLWWKLSRLNTRTNRMSVSRKRMTYDEVTMYLSRVRNRGKYISVLAEEMDKSGRYVLEDGKVVALDSLDDELMFDAIRNEVGWNDEV